MFYLCLFVLVLSGFLRFFVNVAIWGVSPIEVSFVNYSPQSLQFCWISNTELDPYLTESCWNLEKGGTVGMTVYPFHRFAAFVPPPTSAKLFKANEKYANYVRHTKQMRHVIDIRAVWQSRLYGVKYVVDFGTDLNVRYKTWSQALLWLFTDVTGTLVYPSVSLVLKRYRHFIYLFLWAVIVYLWFTERKRVDDACAPPRHAAQSQVNSIANGRKKRKQVTQRYAKSDISNSNSSRYDDMASRGDEMNAIAEKESHDQHRHGVATTHHALVAFAVLCMLLDHYGRVFHSGDEYAWTLAAQFPGAFLFYWCVGANPKAYSTLTTSIVWLYGLSKLVLMVPMDLATETLLAILVCRRVMLNITPERWSVQMHFLLIAFLFHADIFIGGTALMLAYGTRLWFYAFAGRMHVSGHRLLARIYLFCGLLINMQLSHLYVVIPGKFKYHYEISLCGFLSLVVMFAILDNYRFQVLQRPRFVSLYLWRLLSFAIWFIAHYSVFIYIGHIYFFKVVSFVLGPPYWKEDET